MWWRALTLLVVAQVAFAAAPERWSGLAETVFRHFDQDNGLPSSPVTSFAQDPLGFIWVGMQGGLARWDGYRFRSYRAGEGGALPNQFVNTLHVDAAGNLWIGTNSGLARHDAGSDRFLTWAGTEAGFVDSVVLSIADDGAGGIWAAGNGGLHHLASGARRLELQKAGENNFPAGRIGVVARDRDGALWVGAADGLYRRRAGEAGFVHIGLSTRKGPAALVERILQDAGGTIWVGTRHDGVFRMQPSDDRAQPVRARGRDDLSSENVGALEEAAPGIIWIGTYGQGIVVLDVATGAARRIHRDRTVAPTLSDNTVWALMRDRSGSIWTGTNRGISLHNTARAALLAVFAADDRAGIVTDSEIFNVAVARDGRVWLALGTNGVDVIDPVAGRVAQLRPDASKPQAALPKDRVWSLAADDATMWLGTNRGLYRSDIGARRVERVVVPGRSPVENTQCLLLEGHTLYVGGTAGGLWAYDTQRRTARAVAPGTLAKESIVTLSREAMRDGAARLWVATATGLVAITPGDADRVTRVAPTDKEASAMGLAGITSMMRDRGGRLWIGTDGGDLQILTETDGKFRLARVGNRGGGGIDKLLEDSNGHVWASTDAGLMTIDPATLRAHAFSRADGDAFTAGYWADSGAATASGELVFGALGGLTVVRTQSHSPPSATPSVVVSDLRVGSAPVAAYPFMRPGTAPLEIPADANNLAVEFSALDYAAPERNVYEYRLAGLDPDWIATDATRRLATYANLSPGGYTLRLRAGDRNGEWKTAELALPVKVLPAWYQTWWFRMVTALMAMAAIYGIVALRTTALAHQRRELERKVLERTAQLEEASRQLEEASLTDSLTGLRNRRFAMQHLDNDATLAIRRHEQRAPGAPPPADADLVFYLIDIDHFKQVNDVHGHAAGDAVLMQLPDRLKRVFRETDYIIRWGGEEFLVVARGTSREGASDRCERIRAAVAEVEFDLPGGVKLQRTCSIGFAAFPFDPAAPRAMDWAEVIDLADKALYAAKRGGRNQWAGPQVHSTV